MIDPHTNPWESRLQKWFIALLVPAILVNAGGLFIAILEPDGALYATIAKTMARSGDFINLRVEGKDWLDKPHFPFWMAALSFRIFGIHAFAYKLPALLFWGAGAWYTYRLAFSLYGKPVAQLSALIYVSAAHLVISNNDVRAEPYLTGLVIGSVYHFYKASRAKPGPDASRARPFLHLVAGSGLAACAIMTKGPFILLTISAGFILDWVVGKEWHQFRNIRWWIAFLLIALFILPELYCLYVQFDLHPERTVFGHTHVSGIRFFFWDSQFGRFFNTGPIRGSGDPFFYFHTLLWAFLPWSLLLYAAIVQKCRGLRRAGQGAGTGDRHWAVPGDGICLGAALASFALFSLSRFQLPHYLNILFPFFSILTAGYLYGVRRRKTYRIIRIVQGIITVLLPVLLLFLTGYFHFNSWPVLLAALLLLSLLPFWLFRGSELPVPIMRSFYAALLAFAFVNFFLYPAILRYQAGTQAGGYIGTWRSGISLPLPGGAPSPDIYMPEEAPSNYSFEFSSPLPVRRIPVDSLRTITAAGPVLVFSPSSFADSLKAKGFHVDILHRFPNFHVSQLTGEFLDYRTRASVLEWYSMMWVGRQP
jgi:4-amino-4-deoxy-L-arabinose transferase-like glycosyltransferase